MVTLCLRFPGGRYHATPGGHHVNEGHVEWPPSPWRLLRALIATGYNTLGWVDIPEEVSTLIEKMASVLPIYQLPVASVSHSRHYMPYQEGKSEKTTLVFDTWANISEGVVQVTWPVELTPGEYQQLTRLTSNLGYLGRSESWVQADLNPGSATSSVGWPSLPCGNHDSPGPEYEQVTITAPLHPKDFEIWREEAVARALEPYPLPPDRKPNSALLRQRNRAKAPFPKTILEAMQWDTARWKNHRWGQPPGSRRVLYWRRVDALALDLPDPKHVPCAQPVECMLLALATPSRNRSALPTRARTLPQGELLHKSLVARASDHGRIHCPELIGKDEHGNPLQGHEHARILPLDLDRDGHLDHMLIWARMGLGSRAQRAIRSVRRTWQKKGSDLQITVVGSGELATLRSLPKPLRFGIEALLGKHSGSRIWRSTTPYVPPRFPKKTGKNTIEGQILHELADQGYPQAQIRILPWTAETSRLRHAVRVRGGSAKPPPVDCGHVIELNFESPVQGPLALGYASHFGLGLFHAVKEASM